ncbi:protein disulfide isomerase (PDI) protein [Actinomortierella wolfii]|nr:protein disulfide isomerase (PDI) protein [Actinomortierella wolfii]
MKYSSTLLALSAALFSQGVLAGLYNKNDPIIELTPKNFDEEVLRSDHLVFVEFYAPWCGHCKNLVPTYRKAAKNLEGIVKFGAVDCDNDNNRSICSRYGIRGFPTLKAFPGVSNAYKRKHTVGQKTPVDYNGERAPAAIVKFLTSQLPNNVRTVSKRETSERNIHINDLIADENNVRALLLTEKDQPSTMYKGLATEYAHKMHVAMYARPDKETLAKFEVESLPALIVLPKGSQEATKYTGALKREALADFFNTFVSDSDNSSSDSGSTSSSSSTPKEPFDPKIHQVKTQEDLRRECLDKATGTCLVAFMIVEEEFEESVQQHEQNLAVLEQVKKAIYDKQEENGGRVVHFMWMDALKSNVQRLRDSFQISSDIPGLMLVHPRRKAYMPFVGAFDVGGVTKWLNEAASARAHAYPYSHEFALEAEKEKEEKKKVVEEEDVESSSKLEKEDSEDAGIKDQPAGSSNLPKDEL